MLDHWYRSVNGGRPGERLGHALARAFMTIAGQVRGIPEKVF
jgi:hypothetical protein